MRSARLERATVCLEGRCSIQLSYERNHGLDPEGRMRFLFPYIPKSSGWQMKRDSEDLPAIASQQRRVQAVRVQ